MIPNGLQVSSHESWHCFRLRYQQNFRDVCDSLKIAAVCSDYGHCQICNQISYHRSGDIEKITCFKSHDFGSPFFWRSYTVILKEIPWNVAYHAPQEVFIAPGRYVLVARLKIRVNWTTSWSCLLMTYMNFRASFSSESIISGCAGMLPTLRLKIDAILRSLGRVVGG